MWHQPCLAAAASSSRRCEWTKEEEGSWLEVIATAEAEIAWVDDTCVLVFYNVFIRYTSVYTPYKYLPFLFHCPRANLANYVQSMSTSCAHLEFHWQQWKRNSIMPWWNMQQCWGMSWRKYGDKFLASCVGISNKAWSLEKSSHFLHTKMCQENLEIAQSLNKFAISTKVLHINWLVVQILV